MVLDKIAEVKDEYMFQSITDIKNYHQIFPDYVQSVELIENNLGHC